MSVKRIMFSKLLKVRYSFNIYIDINRLLLLCVLCCFLSMSFFQFGLIFLQYTQWRGPEISFCCCRHIMSFTYLNKELLLLLWFCSIISLLNILLNWYLKVAYKQRFRLSLVLLFVISSTTMLMVFLFHPIINNI